MNESQCTREEFLQTIFGMLERKELTYALIFHRLSLAIEYELRRPRKEIRETFIRAFLDLLYIVETSAGFVGDQAHGKLRLAAAKTLRKRKRNR